MEGGQTLKFNCQMEQFVLLAKKARKEPALIAVIKQLLEAPGVYVFGEFLDLPCVQKVTLFILRISPDITHSDT